MAAQSDFEYFLGWADSIIKEHFSNVSPGLTQFILLQVSPRPKGQICKRQPGCQGGFWVSRPP
jgi:hypothetical protein